MAAATNHVWKLLLLTGIILSLVAFILGWIGFGVPDWHSFQRFNNATVEFYGLWAYCQEQSPLYDTVCQRWPTAEDQLFNGSRPHFIRAAEGLITTGMILLSLGLFVGILAVALPYLAYAAALLAFLAFIFLVIGLPIFGRQSNSLSQTRGDYSYNKRYGFWLIVPTIVLEFLATLFFLGAGILYNALGYGNLASGFRNKRPPYSNRGANAGNTAFGGRQFLAQPNRFTVPPVSTIPYGASSPGSYGGDDMTSPALYGTGGMASPDLYGTRGMASPPSYGTGGMASPASYGRGGMASVPYSENPLHNQVIPSLLSQYLAQRTPRLGPSVVRSSGLSALPQPSIVQSITGSPIPNVTPSYLRFGEPIGPHFQPIINLSGQTIVGPIQRTT